MIALISCLVGGIAVASGADQISNHAGLVFLGLLGTALVLALLHVIAVHFWDNTHGNDLSLILALMGLAVYAACVVFMPVVVGIFGSPKSVYGIGAGIMALYTAYATWQVCR